MPVYVYHCSNCGFQFEQNQSFSEAPLIICPDCGKPSLQKVFTPVTVIYKGSGFYSTDHHSHSGSTTPKTPRKKEDKTPENKIGSSTETSKSKDPSNKKESEST